MDHIENDLSNNSSTVVYVYDASVLFLPSRCLGNVFIELLLSNDRGIFTEPLPSKERGIGTYQVS
jgi:hypothetical protein